MTKLLFNFGKTFYDVEEPMPSWTQSSPTDPVECNLCKKTVTFVFPARDLDLAIHASNYMTPVGVRCDCFLEKPDSTQPGYQTKQKREPLKLSLRAVTAPES
jgi:hypothetical protein